MANNKLIVNVKQGEALSIDMVIKSDGEPVDLTNATIKVEVKKAPYVDFEPMFTKTITVDSDQLIDGQIVDPLNGRFQVRFNAEDTSYPPNSYYLVVFFNYGPNSDIISADYCNNGEYRVCAQ